MMDPRDELSEGPFDQALVPEPVEDGLGELRGGAGPSKELAQAFRMNAEALHRLESLQRDMSEAFQRSDRSALMLQSTEALNETFRNVATIQRELLNRLEAPPRAKASPLLKLAVLGLFAILVGATVALVEAIRQQRSEPVNVAKIAEQIHESYVTGQREGEADREREVQRLEEELDAARVRAEESSHTLDEKLDELAEHQRKVRSLERENTDLASHVSKGRDAFIQSELLSQEIEALRRKEMSHDRVVEAYEERLNKLRRKNLDLRQRVADARLGLPPEDGSDLVPVGAAPGSTNVILPKDPDAPFDPEAATDEDVQDLPQIPAVVAELPNASSASEASADPVAPEDPWDEAGSEHAGPVESAEPAARPAADDPLARAPESVPVVPSAEDMPPPVVRPPEGESSAAAEPAPGEVIALDARPLSKDPDRVRRARSSVNALLKRARGPGRGAFMVAGVEGVAEDRLGGVTLVRFDPQGQQDDIFYAKRVEVFADPAGREAYFVLREGTRRNRTRGTSMLPETGQKIRVARSPELVRAWAALDLARKP